MNYQTILKLAQTLIDSTRNSATASVVAMKDFLSKTTLSVKVENQVEPFNGEVTVMNLKGLEDGLKNNALAIRELKKPLEDKKALAEKKPLATPKSLPAQKVTVTNLGSIKFPAATFPKAVKVSNFSDLVPSLKAMADAIEEIQTIRDVQWETNDADTRSHTTYFGEASSGGWRIRKEVEQAVKGGSTTSTRYATIKNNPLITSYSRAWKGRATLAYGYAQDVI